jgi:hypothetical protein
MVLTVLGCTISLFPYAVRVVAVPVDGQCCGRLAWACPVTVVNFVGDWLGLAVVVLVDVVKDWLGLAIAVPLTEYVCD